MILNTQKKKKFSISQLDQIFIFLQSVPSPNIYRRLITIKMTIHYDLGYLLFLRGILKIYIKFRLAKSGHYLRIYPIVLNPRM